MKDIGKVVPLVSVRPRSDAWAQTLKCRGRNDWPSENENPRCKTDKPRLTNIGWELRRESQIPELELSSNDSKLMKANFVPSSGSNLVLVLGVTSWSEYWSYSASDRFTFLALILTQRGSIKGLKRELNRFSSCDHFWIFFNCSTTTKYTKHIAIVLTAFIKVVKYHTYANTVTFDNSNR